MSFLEYQGSVYVTLLSVGQRMGKDVGWDTVMQTVRLSGEREPEIRASSMYAPEQDAIRPAVEKTAAGLVLLEGNSLSQG